VSIAKIRVSAKQSSVSVLQTKTVVAVKTVRTKINVGLQGIRGTAGQDNTFITRNTAHIVSGERVVRLTANGTVEYASNEPGGYQNSAGLTKHSAIEGQPVQIASFGDYEFNGWNWTPLLPIFLGVDGFITQTPPTSGVSLQVATAISATKIFIKIGEPIILV
jgi:hypothetical protein